MVSFLFFATSLLSMVFFYIGTGKDKRVLFLSILWMLFIGAIAFTGFFENTSVIPPRFLLVIAGGILLTVYFYRIVNSAKLNTRYLFAVHTLRVPVEIGLYQLFLEKKVPIFMTFKGWNFDILVGISAILIIGYLMISKNKLSRFFKLWWNGIGIVLLAIIVGIAILSSPLPIQQIAFNQPNVAVLEFPFIFLPAYIVPVVLLSHLLVIRDNLN